MDEIDTKLLKILAENADITTTEMMPLLNLSIPAINKRIAKLKQSGVIRRFTIMIDAKKIGKPIQAFILIVLEQFACMEEMMQFILSDPDVLECYAITGEYDYILKVCAHDIEALEAKLLHLKSQKGIVKSYTLLSLMEHKYMPSALPD